VVPGVVPGAVPGTAPGAVPGVAPGAAPVERATVTSTTVKEQQKDAKKPLSLFDDDTEEDLFATSSKVNKSTVSTQDNKQVNFLVLAEQPTAWLLSNQQHCYCYSTVHR